MANITTQTIRVDLSTGKVIPTAYTHQNDTARTLVFDMYNGGMPYTMTGNTVKFAYKSPIVNGQYSVIAGASMASGTVSGNKVSVTLPVAYTQISGVGMLTMIITPTSGTVRPVNIRLVVQKSADGANEIVGASDFPATLGEIAEDWLEENISIQIDDTLSVSGKAADAKVTGDEISELDGQIGDLKSDINDTQDWLGYPKNLFDARLFTTTNPTNFTLTTTKSDLTVVHNNGYSNGMPVATLDLEAGEYTFTAEFSDATIKFMQLLVNGTFSKNIYSGDSFTVVDGSAYTFRYYVANPGTYSVTNISVIGDASGKIQEINDSVEDLTAEVASADKKITDLESGFYDIADDAVEEITGTETVNKAITSSGSIASAGSNNYKIISYDVTEKKKYWVSGSANWGNLEWAFYDSNENLVEKGTASESGSAFTTFSDVEVETPVGATVLIVSCNVTSLEGKCKTQTGFSPKKKWNGIKWVCVGDSLTAENIRTTKHYFDYVSEKTGISIVNMGVSGSGYARMADTSQAFYQRISSCPTDADVVTIFGSFNDLGAGLSIGSVNDTGTDTLAGCINTTITNLQTVIPLVNLGIVAPTPWDTTQPSDSGQAYNYVNMLKKICEHRSIPFLDLWRCSNLRPWDADFRAIAYSKDGGSGTHPDENGHKLIAPRFEAFLDSLLLY